MLSFINFEDYPEKLEIIGDKEGLTELVKIIQYVINNQEHFHLTEGNEIDEYKTNREDIKGITSVKSIYIEYMKNS